MNNPPPEYDAKMLGPLARLFSASVKAYGANHKAVAWRDAVRQNRRFQIFSGIMAYAESGLVINDLGCGYGAMFEAYQDEPFLKGGRYFGYDISTEMITAAQKRIRDPRAQFEVSHIATHEADYSFVSGTYNMKLNVKDDPWRELVQESLIHLWSQTKTGLAFNMLSTFNPGRENSLYYANPDDYTDFCRQNLSSNIRLVASMAPDEWTIFILR